VAANVDDMEYAACAPQIFMQLHEFASFAANKAPMYIQDV
jgi:hypothetical protein